MSAPIVNMDRRSPNILENQAQQFGEGVRDRNPVGSVSEIQEIHGVGGGGWRGSISHSINMVRQKTHISDLMQAFATFQSHE